MDYDLLILGGGSAGYNAASTACGLGLKVAIVEGASELGGLCILRGCMPSKAILESANRYMTLRRAGEFGLAAGDISFCATKIRERKEALVKDFADYRAKQLSSGRFDLHRGWGRFVDPHTLEVTPLAEEEGGEGGEVKRLTARTFLLATGSRLKKLDIPGLEETGYWSSDDVLRLQHIPRSLIVLGGGATALEFSHFYAALGTKVTIIQRGKNVLTDMDGDIGRTLEEAYKKRGMLVYTHTELLQIDRGESGLKRVRFRHGGKERVVEGEEILYALGREPALEGLGLETAGLELTKGRLHVSCAQQTRQAHIFAAGDASGPYEVVHIAIQQAELAVRNAARFLRDGECALEEIDYRLRLFAVFSSPEVAMVGYTEKDLSAASIPYRVATYPFDDHGKSMIEGETEGFVKLIASGESGEILGAAVIGPHAAELIHEMVVAIRFRATARDVMAIPHYHPTLSEIWTYPAEELA